MRYLREMYELSRMEEVMSVRMLYIRNHGMDFDKSGIRDCTKVCPATVIFIHIGPI